MTRRSMVKVAGIGLGTVAVAGVGVSPGHEYRARKEIKRLV
jgi:hypothetical protein